MRDRPGCGDPRGFACASAGTFAQAGVEILENLGVEYISFGSESGNIEELSRIARTIKENAGEIQERMEKGTKEGLSYPRARREAVRSLMGENGVHVIESPNNILAIEYINAVKRARPMTVKRLGPGYNDRGADDRFASATAIREMIAKGKDISRLLPENHMIFFLEQTDHLKEDF